MSTSGSLTYRPVRSEDMPVLIAMRRECGWGEDHLPHHFERIKAGHEHMFLFLHGGEPMGMAAVDIIDGFEDDRELCDPDKDIVMISSLCILKKFQGLKLGNEVMDLIEGIAARQFGARRVTINTREFSDDVRMDTPSRNKLWYLRRGYVEFRAPRGRYPGDEPGTKIIACFLAKDVPASASVPTIVNASTAEATELVGAGVAVQA